MSPYILITSSSPGEFAYISVQVRLWKHDDDLFVMPLLRTLCRELSGVEPSGHDGRRKRARIDSSGYSAVVTSSDHLLQLSSSVEGLEVAAKLGKDKEFYDNVTDIVKVLMLPSNGD
jgi:hypothetical protein